MPLMKSDDGLFVEFYIDAVPHAAESEKQGRPIFHDVEHVKIIVPGDNKTEIVRQATDEDRERFGRIYEAFRKSGEKAVVGTPIEEWPALGKSDAKELKGVGFRTVEQLASVNDATKATMAPELRGRVAQAQAYLAQAQSLSAVERYAAENERMRGEVARLESEVARLASDLKEAREKRPVGRPAREAA